MRTNVAILILFVLNQLVFAQMSGRTFEDAEQKEQPSGFGMGLAVGAVTIDGELYNQIGLRPEFSVGKLGVALDLSLYIDNDGNIRKENWDSADDIFEKLYYVRWGHQGDPLYVKVGAIDNYRLGFGLLMNHYSNTIEYPSVIRTGMELGIQAGPVGFQGMLNNFSELTNEGGLMAGRISYKLIGNLELGASVVYDRNQYSALRDDDDDGIPNYLDDFPNDKTYAVDTDGDGQPDETDRDIDGDGWTDNSDDPNRPNNDDFISRKPDPFKISDAEDKSQIAFGLDISYPLINYDYLQLITYGQYAQFGNDGGWGIAAPGLLAKFAFINVYAEYRIFDKKFIPEYFNTTYELERAVFSTDSLGNPVPFTKRELLQTINEELQGYIVGADFNLFNFVIFGAEYQNMSKSTIDFKTIRGTLDLNTKFVPKISRAGGFYFQNNVNEFFKKDEGTILGYRIEYEIAPGANLLYEYRQTYRDINGDGKIAGTEETVRTTNIGTVFRF